MYQHFHKNLNLNRDINKTVIIINLMKQILDSELHKKMSRF